MTFSESEAGQRCTQEDDGLEGSVQPVELHLREVAGGVRKLLQGKHPKLS